MNLATMHLPGEWMEAKTEDKVGQLVRLIERITSDDIRTISAECHDALTSAWASMGTKLKAAAHGIDGLAESSEVDYANTGWMEMGTEGRITQLLHLEESLSVRAIEKLAARIHIALTAAWVMLDGNIHAAAPSRCSRIDTAAMKAQESLHCLHDGEADKIGAQVGATTEDFV